MFNRNNGPIVDLDDVLGWDAPWEADTRAPHRRRAVRALVGAVVGCGVLFGVAVTPVVAPAGIAVRDAGNWFDNLPSTLPDTPMPQWTTMLAADGSPLATLYSENRVTVTLDQIPQVTRDALVATEDASFYTNSGIDLKGTLRALVNDLRGGNTQGGSTLTQQYVKNVLLLDANTAAERDAVAGQNVNRKVREARIALSLSKTMSKDQILTGYFNVAAFGDGVYGIGTASQHYFGKNVTDLTLPESALLVGLVKNPTGYDPTDHPQAAVDRRNVVLGRMLTTGKITQAQYDQAKATPLTLHITDPANGCLTSPFPFFCQWVKQTLATDPAFGATQDARDANLYRGGMIIHTTIDPRQQNIAQAAVDRALGRDNRVAASSVTVQPGTGYVTAMAVNRDFGTGPNQTEVLLPVSTTQPGSTMKAFTLATALEQGYNLNTMWTAPDRYAPPGLSSPDGGFHNSGPLDAGTMNAETALWRSSNTWFVHLESQVGVLGVADMAGRLGITTLPRTGPRAITARDASLTLGAYEVSPVEMAAAYSAFADHGITCKATPISAITTTDGKPLPIPDTNCHQAISPGIADTMASIMQGVIDGPDPYRTGAKNNIGRPAAAKTGTTNGNSAVWMIGYTPQYSTAVAVSDPRGGNKYPLKDITAYNHYVASAWGGETSGPIWQEVMKGIMAPLPVEQFAPADPTVATGIDYITPDVRGLDRDKAIQVLQGAGFTVTINPQTTPADPLLAKNRIAAQDPAPGGKAGIGATVTLTLTHGSDTHVIIPPLAKR